MASIIFKKTYIKDYYSIVGPYEKESKLSSFDQEISNFYNDKSTIEEAEISMQENVINNILINNNLSEKNVDLLVGGDLLDQITMTTYNARNFNIPLCGVYAACATFPLSLIVLSNFIENKMIKNGIAITSAHNLSAEKQFRFPIEYGAIKPKRSTITATGSVGCLVSNEPTDIKIESATIGSVIDYGIKDVFNMGAVMAPAAAHTILKHLEDLKRDINYYDLILTGDLGKVGMDILKELLQANNINKIKKCNDAGCILYDLNDSENKSGASGPIVLPLIFFNNILKNKKYHKVLLVGTGALHSPTMVNQKKSIPAIAHAISIEVN